MSMEKWIGQVVALLVKTGSRKATKYISEKEVITATRRTYDGRILRGNVDVVLKIGKPNYAEREFIKTLKQAGEPFPVKKIVLKPLINKKKK